MRKSLFFLLVAVAIGANANDSLLNKKFITDDSISHKIDINSISIRDTLNVKVNISEPKSDDKIWPFINTLVSVLIGGVITIIVQKILKSDEKGINSFTIKEEKKIEKLEDIFRMINALSLIDIKSSSDLIKEVTVVERHVSQNTLFIDKGFERLIYDWCDYYKEVAGDFTRKDYSRELEFVRSFKRLFNQ